jgi:hypothetical protein
MKKTYIKPATVKSQNLAQINAGPISKSDRRD